ncbi:hypothetical protein QUF80_01615 [Desulfococcaceae bacterium HSG8]|nr:hypothetical protein [Desulfococcaceae bacterium HSG8]
MNKGRFSAIIINSSNENLRDSAHHVSRFTFHALRITFIEY